MDRSDERGRLTLALVKTVLVAAVVTAPVFLFGEGFEAKYVGRVAASNGVCVALCLGLLGLIRRGKVELAGTLLALGLLGLVGTLASVNGERVHVNVVNFVLVTLLASAVGSRGLLAFVALASSATMVGIAWARPFAEAGQDVEEARFEAIVQFLPTYLVIVAVLWMGRRR